MQVATDSLFASLVINDSTLTTTHKLVSALLNKTKYYWRTSAKNIGGTSSYSAIFNFTTGATDVETSVELKMEFTLGQNYPNPFNPTTTLEYRVPVDSKVKVEVYNVLGQLVAVLVDEVRKAGYYKVTFGSQSMPSGVYFYRMTAGSFEQSKKMQLIK